MRTLQHPAVVSTLIAFAAASLVYVGFLAFTLPPPPSAQVPPDYVSRALWYLLSAFTFLVQFVLVVLTLAFSVFLGHLSYDLYLDRFPPGPDSDSR